MTAHPEGNPHIAKQIDINKHNPLLESLSEALDEALDTQDYNKNEDETIDQNNGLEVKISKEESKNLPTIDLGEVPLMPTRISLQDSTLHLGTTIRMMEDHMNDAQISHSIEAMETDLEMNLSTIGMEIGGTMENFVVLHRFQGETSHKIIPIVNQEVINLTTLRSTDLTIDLRLVLRPVNRIFRRTIIRDHLMLFVSPQPMIS